MRNWQNNTGSVKSVDRFLPKRTADCHVALIRPGSRRPTFPPWEGFANAAQTCSVVPSYNIWYRSKPFPRGKVDAKRTDEGYLPQALRSVPREHRRIQNHQSNPFAKQNSITYKPLQATAQRGSLLSKIRENGHSSSFINVSAATHSRMMTAPTIPSRDRRSSNKMREKRAVSTGQMHCSRATVREEMWPRAAFCSR